MRSQTGPLSSLPFNVLPTNRFTRFDQQPSVCSSFDTCTFPSTSPHVSADVADRSMLVAIIALRVRLQGFLGERATRWKLLQPRYTMVRDLDLLPGALLDNWSQTFCPCSMGHNSQSTQQWCQTSDAMAQPDEGPSTPVEPTSCP